MQATFKDSTKKPGYTLVNCEYNALMVQLMHQIDAEFLKDAKKTWRFHSAFRPLVERELALITPEMSRERWLPNRMTGEMVRSGYIYDSLPKTPEEAEKLEALRSNAQTEQPEPAPMETSVVTVPAPATPVPPAAPKREPVCYTTGGSYRAGEISIVGIRPEEQRVLIALEKSTWVHEDAESGPDPISGWVTDWYEPTADEQQTPDYQRLSAKLAQDQAEEEAKREEIRQRSERERAAITHTPEEYESAKEAGIDLDLWDDLFAGSSDN